MDDRNSRGDSVATCPWQSVLAEELWNALSDDSSEDAQRPAAVHARQLLPEFPENNPGLGFDQLRGGTLEMGVPDIILLLET